MQFQKHKKLTQKQQLIRKLQNSNEVITKSNVIYENNELEIIKKKIKTNRIELSRNLWLTIFSYCEIIDLMKCEQICKEWKTFIRSQNHQLNIIFANIKLQKEEQIKPKSLNWIIKQLKFQNLIQFNCFINEVKWNLKQSYIKSYFKFIKFLFSNISKMTNLKSLNLTFFYFSKFKQYYGYFNAPLFQELFSNINNLESIKFRFFEDADVDGFEILLKQSYKTLKYISVTDKLWQCSTVVNPLRILKLLNKNQIQGIEYYCWGGEWKDEVVVDYLLKFKYITKLYLDNLSITQSSKQKLIKTFGFQLNEISLTNLNDESLHLISDYCPNLIKLTLRRCEKIRDQSVHQLLTKCNKIEFLDLRSCKLSMKSFPTQLNNIKVIVPYEQFNRKELDDFEDKFKTAKIYYDNNELTNFYESDRLI